MRRVWIVALAVAIAPACASPKADGGPPSPAAAEQAGRLRFRVETVASFLGL